MRVDHVVEHAHRDALLADWSRFVARPSLEKPQLDRRELDPWPQIRLQIDQERGTVPVAAPDGGENRDEDGERPPHSVIIHHAATADGGSPFEALTQGAVREYRYFVCVDCGFYERYMTPAVILSLLEEGTLALTEKAKSAPNR
jgi:hypothetical protein